MVMQTYKATKDTQARCKLCRVDISLSNRGIMAVKSHMNNKPIKNTSKSSGKLRTFSAKKVKILKNY